MTPQKQPAIYHDPVHWRLVYPDDYMLEEPPEGGSIVLAFSEPLELHVVYRNGEVVHRVDLRDGHGHPAYRPIWYRERSHTINVPVPGKSVGLGGGIGALVEDPTKVPRSKLEATVYGRGRVGYQNCDVTLWALVGDKIIDCPQELFRQADIERLLTWPQNPRTISVS